MGSPLWWSMSVNIHYYYYYYYYDAKHIVPLINQWTGAWCRRATVYYMHARKVHDPKHLVPLINQWTGARCRRAAIKEDNCSLVWSDRFAGTRKGQLWRRLTPLVPHPPLPPPPPQRLCQLMRQKLIDCLQSPSWKKGLFGNIDCYARLLIFLACPCGSCRAEKR